MAESAPGKSLPSPLVINLSEDDEDMPGGMAMPDDDLDPNDMYGVSSPLARSGEMILEEDVHAMKYKELKAYIIESGVPLPEVCTIQNLFRTIKTHFEWKKEGFTTTLFIDGVARMITTDHVRKGVDEYDSRRVADERQREIREKEEASRRKHEEMIGKKSQMREVGIKEDDKYVPPAHHDGHAHVAIKADKESLPFEKAAKATEKWWLRMDKGVDISKISGSEVVTTPRGFCSLGLRCAHVHINNPENQANVFARVDFQFAIGRQTPITICQASNACCTIIDTDKAGFSIYASLLTEQEFVQCNYIALKEGYRAARFHNGLSLEYQAFCIEVPGSETPWIDLEIIYPEAFEVPVFQIMCTPVGPFIFSTVITRMDSDKATIRLFNKANLGWKKDQIMLNVIVFSCDSLVVLEHEDNVSKGQTDIFAAHAISKYDDAVSLTNLIANTENLMCATPITKATGEAINVAIYSEGDASDVTTRTLLFTNRCETADEG